ncbi:MAG: class I SAM-dependent methyltransferase [Actinobacteria bacterium]|nr:class I SAM-dependent methyltransferase [Actinomycetota bacterium]
MSVSPIGLNSIKAPLRPLARKLGLAAPAGDWWEARQGPWVVDPKATSHPAACNICRWHGPAFDGPFHSEMAQCPQCGSIARDRFLMHCFVSRVRKPKGLRILETSPRLGDKYRLMMRRHFRYTASDFDLSAHEGDIQIDLQNIALPDSSIDVLLTPHVLEHVPDTKRALSEIYRMLAPGGHMFLQVPLLEGATNVPSTPEFHADNTPVFFRFGWDLTFTLREMGFTAQVLVTEEWRDMLLGRVPAPPSNGDGFVVESLVEVARHTLDFDRDIAIAATNQESRAYGFLPPYHFATWHCHKPR